MLWVDFKINYRWRVQVGYSFSHGSAYYGSKWYRLKSWVCYSIICDPYFERYNWSCKIKIQTRRQRLLLWWRIDIQVFTSESVSVRKKNIKVNSIQEACAKCFAVHIHIKFWNLVKQLKNKNKKDQNTRSIGEKLKTKSLMFFVSFSASLLYWVYFTVLFNEL